MMGQAGEAKVIPFTLPSRAAASAEIDDLRFRALLPEEQWARLPSAVRARFGKRVAHCRTVHYAGEIVECRMSRLGWGLAQLARLIGAPLPLHRDILVPASVCISEDEAFGGQFWIRVYGRRRGFPQVIHSSKRFCGPTGLEEYVGRGFGLALRALVEGDALHFVSDHYFFAAGPLRLRLPDWLAPGELRVSHVDCNHGRFAFVLRLRHRLFGELVVQTAMFDDPPGDDRT